jgi:2-polyprenyl-3-methyl-5-hydroxy-6-metoxy-1,4-benzoquinol methylase
MKPCVVCGNINFRQIFSKKSRNFWRCENCHLEFQFPLPTNEKLRNYYIEAYETGLYKDFTEAIDMKVITAKTRYSQIKNFLIPGRLLDIGCADGRFVEFITGKGILPEGIDISPVAVFLAQQRNIPVKCSTIENWWNKYKESRYANITAFDVIEHVTNPDSFIRHAFKLLAPGGVFILTTPNVQGIVRKIMKEKWYFYIPEEHLYYFNKKNISLLAEKEGLQKITIKPAKKPITYNYAICQFEEYNPKIGKILKHLSIFIPGFMKKLPINLFIGELLIILKKPVYCPYQTHSKLR